MLMYEWLNGRFHGGSIPVLQVDPPFGKRKLYIPQPLFPKKGEGELDSKSLARLGRGI